MIADPQQTDLIPNLDDKKLRKLIAKPFGAENRGRLIQLYLDSEAGVPDPRNAWIHVYRMLLWVDQTIGLAHCYESDKSQPGRPWYARSLAFHSWLSDELGVKPSVLGEQVDWLFRRAVTDLAAAILSLQDRRDRATEKQRAGYGGLPLPGEDPELTQIIREVLGEHLSPDVPEERWRLLVQRIRQHLGLENKRKNLVGEGFEDIIGALVKAIAGGTLDVSTRRLLHDLPGFNRVREGDKPNKVDVAIVNPASGKRTLVTAKWSVRADREKQFITDFGDYISAESSRKPFDYVLVTNEFDPARLMRACDGLVGNAQMFAHVVHVNTDGIRAAYGSAKKSSAQKVLEYIESGRLESFDTWLEALIA